MLRDELYLSDFEVDEDLDLDRKSQSDIQPKTRHEKEEEEDEYENESFEKPEEYEGDHEFDEETEKYEGEIKSKGELGIGNEGKTSFGQRKTSRVSLDNKTTQNSMKAKRNDAEADNQQREVKPKRIKIESFMANDSEKGPGKPSEIEKVSHSLASGFRMSDLNQKTQSEFVRDFRRNSDVSSKAKEERRSTRALSKTNSKDFLIFPNQEDIQPDQKAEDSFPTILHFKNPLNALKSFVSQVPVHPISSNLPRSNKPTYLAHPLTASSILMENLRRRKDQNLMNPKKDQNTQKKSTISFVKHSVFMQNFLRNENSKLREELESFCDAAKWRKVEEELQETGNKLKALQKKNKEVEVKLENSGKTNEKRIRQMMEAEKEKIENERNAIRLEREKAMTRAQITKGLEGLMECLESQNGELNAKTQKIIEMAESLVIDWDKNEEYKEQLQKMAGILEKESKRTENLLSLAKQERKLKEKRKEAWKMEKMIERIRQEAKEHQNAKSRAKSQRKVHSSRKESKEEKPRSLTKEKPKGNLANGEQNYELPRIKKSKKVTEDERIKKFLEENEGDTRNEQKDKEKKKNEKNKELHEKREEAILMTAVDYEEDYEEDYEDVFEQVKDEEHYSCYSFEEENQTT